MMMISGDKALSLQLTAIHYDRGLLTTEQADLFIGELKKLGIYDRLFPKGHKPYVCTLRMLQ